MDEEGFFGKLGIRRNALQQATGIARIVACASVVLVTASCGTDEPSRQPNGSSAEALNSSPTIANFVLYAERSVTVGSHDSVAGGDVGVRATVASSFGPQLAIGDHATVDSARNLLAPSISLASHASVGNVQTSVLQNNGGSFAHLGAFAASTMPPVPLARSGAAGSDISVASHQSVTLAPGSYGALRISDHSGVTLNSGTYSFTSVAMADHAQLSASAGGAHIQVSGMFATVGWASIRPLGNQTAEKLSILVGAYDGTSGAPAAVTLGTHTGITALFVAPRGTISVADHVDMTGAFAAFDIKLSDHVTAQYQSGFTVGAAGQQGQQQLQGYIATLPSAPSAQRRQRAVQTSVLPERDLPQDSRSALNILAFPGGRRRALETSQPSDPTAPLTWEQIPRMNRRPSLTARPRRSTTS